MAGSVNPTTYVPREVSVESSVSSSSSWGYTMSQFFLCHTNRGTVLGRGKGKEEVDGGIRTIIFLLQLTLRT